MEPGRHTWIGGGRIFPLRAKSSASADGSLQVRFGGEGSARLPFLDTHKPSGATRYNLALLAPGGLRSACRCDSMQVGIHLFRTATRPTQRGAAALEPKWCAEGP